MQKVRTLARQGPAADFAKGKYPPSYAVVSEVCITLTDLSYTIKQQQH